MYRTYGTGKTVLGFLQFIGWLMVGLGALTALLPYLDSATRVTTPMIGIIIGVVIASYGLLVVAISQIGLAQIDTAENTSRILEHMRSSTVRSAPSLKSNLIKNFKGREILSAADGCTVDGVNFDNVLMAEKYISENS